MSMRLAALAAIICSLAAPVQAADDAGEFYRSGMRLLAENKPEEALAAFRRALQLRPDYAAAWSAVGVTHATRGDYGRAEEPFHRACLLDPALPDACLYFGRTLYLEDRFEEALAVLGTAGGRDPGNAQIRRIQALCLEALGRAGEAESAFREAIKLERPSARDEDPAVDYGVFLYRAGRPREAIEPLGTAVRRHPDSGRAHLELGNVLLSLDRAGDAVAHLQRAAAIDPNSRRAHLLLGKAYLRLGNRKAGERELARAESSPQRR